MLHRTDYFILPVGGKSFRYFDQRIQYLGAQSKCRELGGDLACPRNSAQNLAISTIIS